MPEDEWRKWMEDRIIAIQTNHDLLAGQFSVFMGVVREFMTRDDERRKTLEDVTKDAADRATRRENKINLAIALLVALIALLTYLGFSKEHKDSMLQSTTQTQTASQHAGADLTPPPEN